MKIKANRISKLIISTLGFFTSMAQAQNCNMRCFCVDVMNSYFAPVNIQVSCSNHYAPSLYNGSFCATYVRMPSGTINVIQGTYSDCVIEPTSVFVSN